MTCSRKIHDFRDIGQHIEPLHQIQYADGGPFGEHRARAGKKLREPLFASQGLAGLAGPAWKVDRPYGLIDKHLGNGCFGYCAPVDSRWLWVNAFSSTRAGPVN